MRGLLLKEFLMIKKQWLPYLLIIGGFSVAAVGDISFSLVMAVIMSVIPINRISLDEMSRWQQYAVVLPYGRKNIVSSKYIFYIINTLFLMLMLTLIYILSDALNFSSCIGLPFILIAGLISGNIYPLIMLPIIFKFNSTTGRTILMIVSMAFAGIVGGTVSTMMTEDFVSKINAREFFVNTFNSPLPSIIVVAVIAVLYLISWAVSIKIYEKRDL